MSRWLSQNISLLFLSLLLAFFFWAVALEAEDPTVLDVYLTSIPVSPEGLPENMIAEEADGVRVRVTIRTPQSIWRTLRPEEITAWMDLSQVTSGTVKVPINVQIDREPLEIVNVAPAEVTLDIETISEKEVPVVVKLTGNPAIGYKADSPLVAPRTVLVEGPTSLVSKVTEAQVTIPIQDQVSEVESDVSPKPIDNKGNTVPNIEIIPKTVTVNVPISGLGYFREVPVSVGLEGQPAPGYRLVSLEVDPQVVTVLGRSSVVQSVRYLQTEPLTIEGITQSLTTSIALQMPEGLSILQPPSPNVTASVSVEAIRSSLTLELEPQIQGLGRNLTATVEIDTIVILLSGPYSITEALDPKAVTLTLDLTNLAVGEYSIKPSLTVPESIDIENIIPELIPVNIERKPPEATPTPEAEQETTE